MRSNRACLLACEILRLKRSLCDRRAQVASSMNDFLGARLSIGQAAVRAEWMVEFKAWTWVSMSQCQVQSVWGSRLIELRLLAIRVRS